MVKKKRTLTEQADMPTPSTLLAECKFTRPGWGLAAPEILLERGLDRRPPAGKASACWH